MQRISEAERSGGSLCAQGVGAKTDADIHDFRNQLKESFSQFVPFTTNRRTFDRQNS